MLNTIGFFLIVIVGAVWLIYRNQARCRVPARRIKHDELIETWSREGEQLILLQGFRYVYESEHGQKEGDWVYDDKSADSLRIHLKNAFPQPESHLILTPIECQRTLFLQALIATESDGELHFNPHGSEKFKQLL